MSRPPRAATASDDTSSAADRDLRRKKRELAALVVHDLRSPLSATAGCLQLLRRELAAGADPAQIAGILDGADALIAKALSLVATILDVDELEDGILRASPSQVELAPMVQAARVNSRADSELRELTFELDMAPGLTVAVDRDLMTRVLENLVDNAVRYAPRRGRVAVAARTEDDVLELTVGNDGPPVPVAEREAIFGRYHQVEARRASARANRGLGLYFCRLAVEAHGGTIRVEPRGPLCAVFVIRIPQR
ncbi:MAG: HAMP domain-containing histidine kinase [Kofleriaceae bacterium]|nr:HAMP domain-containing histidine kinase [Kofleriaceae bacterium]MBP6836531.1 HAMP domain-containing histidine kinase [Kofleriaceae bacterium]MBP9206403.1 HAMP domain-containing histidine kinase [Kofleriaceae bacterium]